MMRWRSIGQTSFGTDLNEDKSKSLEGTGSKRKRHSGIQISFITQICGGETFCIAMNDTNQLIGWGSAFYGELGAEDGIQGSTMNEEYQVICAKPHVLFPSSLLRWQRVACGWHHVLAVIDKGIFTALSHFSRSQDSCMHGDRIRTAKSVHFRQIQNPTTNYQIASLLPISSPCQSLSFKYLPALDTQCYSIKVIDFGLGDETGMVN